MPTVGSHFLEEDLLNIQGTQHHITITMYAKAVTFANHSMYDYIRLGNARLYSAAARKHRGLIRVTTVIWFAGR